MKKVKLRRRPKDFVKKLKPAEKYIPTVKSTWLDSSWRSYYPILKNPFTPIVMVQA